MRAKLKTLTVLVFSNLFVFSAHAQFPGGGPPDFPDGPPSDRQAGPQTPNPKQFLNHVAKTLKLTDSQKTQIEPILNSENHELSELKTTNLSEEKFERFAAIEDKTWAAIRPLLNPAQQKKFDSMTKKMQERRERASRQGDDMQMPPDGPPPGGPPPGGAPPF